MRSSQGMTSLWLSPAFPSIVDSTVSLRKALVQSTHSLLFVWSNIHPFDAIGLCSFDGERGLEAHLLEAKDHEAMVRSLLSNFAHCKSSQVFVNSLEDLYELWQGQDFDHDRCKESFHTFFRRRAKLLQKPLYRHFHGSGYAMNFGRTRGRDLLPNHS